jgi:hypothetical protein
MSSGSERIGDSALLDDLRILQTILAFSGVGRQLLAAYNNADLRQRALEAMTKDTELRLATFGLVFKGFAVARGLTIKGSPHRPIPLNPAGNCGETPITKGLVAEVQHWGRLIVKQGGDDFSVHVERFVKLVGSLAGLERREAMARLLDSNGTE